MKKILIIVATVIVALALTPIVGNQIIESKIDENINKLSSSGLKIKNQKSESGYLSASKHYEFVIDDSKEFAKFLSQMTNQQISPYADSVFDGSVVGVDLNYNNVPLLKSTTIEIYPISLSDKIMDKIEEEDQKFAEYLMSLLEKKALLYHVKYDVLSKDFDGYVKDIKESYEFKTGQRVELELTGSKFNGNGNLASPRYMKSKTNKMYLYFTDSHDEIKISLEQISASSSFESITSYNSSVVLKSMQFDMKGKYQKDSKANIENLNFGFASSTDGESAKFLSKASFEKFFLDAQNESVDVKNFNFDLALKDIDKDSYEELNNLLRSGANFNSSSMNYKLQKLFQELFLRGFTLDVKDISVENVRVDGKKDLGSSLLKANIKLPKNSSKSTSNPMAVADKVVVDMLLDISKPMFEVLTKTTPAVALSRGFAKDQGDSLVFDVKVKDGSVTVNDKKVR